MVTTNVTSIVCPFICDALPRSDQATDVHDGGGGGSHWLRTISSAPSVGISLQRQGLNLGEVITAPCPRSPCF